MEKFNIEEQYQLYLQRISLNEKTMHPLQRIQLRQTFFGAFGQALILMRDEVGAIENEDEAIEVMKNMINQVGQFFLSETNRNN